MKYYYSAKTKGFYVRHIHRAMPDDVVEIDAQTHQALLHANAKKARIEVNAKGEPQAVFPPPEQVLAEEKEATLSRLTGLIRSQRQQAISAHDESEVAICLHRYRTALAMQSGAASPEEQNAFAKEIEVRALNESLESFCADVLKRGARLLQIISITEGLKHRLTQVINQASTQIQISALEQDFRTSLTVALASLTESN